LFVWSEVENALGSVGVFHDGDAVGGGESLKESHRGLQVIALEEIDGGASFDEQKDLGGFIDVSEVSDGLFDAVVEDMKLRAREGINETAARVGDDDADVDAVDGYTHCGSLRCRRLLSADA